MKLKFTWFGWLQMAQKVSYRRASEENEREDDICKDCMRSHVSKFTCCLLLSGKEIV
jgi:hypothetical protein